MEKPHPPGSGLERRGDFLVRAVRQFRKRDRSPMGTDKRKKEGAGLGRRFEGPPGSLDEDDGPAGRSGQPRQKVRPGGRGNAPDGHSAFALVDEADQFLEFRGVEKKTEAHPAIITDKVQRSRRGKIGSPAGLKHRK